MSFLKNKLLSIWLCIWIGSCAWLGAETPPEWILSPHRSYPTEQFLTGIGDASNRNQAEQRAYAAVARIFSAKIQAQSMDQESYASQEAGDMSRTQRTLKLDQRTQVTTSKVLKNVKIFEVWHQPSTQRFFALAGLDRLQAEQTIMDRLREWDLKIGNSVEQGRSDLRKIQRIRGYKRALTLLADREHLNADLRVIRTSGKSQPPSYRISDIQREFQNFVAQELVISVSMEGESHAEIERAIGEALKQEGLISGTTYPNEGVKHGEEDIAIIGRGKLWSIDLPDPLFKYVRWCGDIDVYEKPSHQLIGVISKTGREGHITELEARVRANGAMQQVLSREVARLLTHSVFEEREQESSNSQNSKACPQ